MLFPGPTSSSSSSYQMPTSAMGGGSYNFHGFGNMEGQIPNRFLGLKPADQTNDVEKGEVSERGNDVKDDGGGTGKKKGEKKVRKPRFAFQTRSQVDILDDGYRWRKYGQKAVKNNKFPRQIFYFHFVLVLQAIYIDSIACALLIYLERWYVMFCFYFLLGD